MGRNSGFSYTLDVKRSLPYIHYVAVLWEDSIEETLQARGEQFVCAYMDHPTLVNPYQQNVSTKFKNFMVKSVQDVCYSIYGTNIEWELGQLNSKMAQAVTPFYMR